MTETKITKRDRYNEIIAILAGIEGTSDLIDFCEAEIELLNKKAAKVKEAAAAKKAEVDPLTEAVKAALTDEFKTIADVTAALDPALDATPSKVSNRLSGLVKAGAAEDTMVSVPGVDGAKARKVKGYRAIAG